MSEQFMFKDFDTTDFRGDTKITCILVSNSSTREYKPIAKNKIVGKCMYNLHRGLLTKELMISHDCLNKQCPFFHKAKGSYWDAVEAEKKHKEKVKAMRISEQKKEQAEADKMLKLVNWFNVLSFNQGLNFYIVRATRKDTTHILMNCINEENNYNAVTKFKNFTNKILSNRLITLEYKDIKLPNGRLATLDEWLAHNDLDLSFEDDEQKAGEMMFIGNRVADSIFLEYQAEQKAKAPSGPENPLKPKGYTFYNLVGIDDIGKKEGQRVLDYNKIIHDLGLSNKVLIARARKGTDDNMLVYYIADMDIEAGYFKIVEALRNHYNENFIFRQIMYSFDKPATIEYWYKTVDYNTELLAKLERDFSNRTGKTYPEIRLPNKTIKRLEAEKLNAEVKKIEAEVEEIEAHIEEAHLEETYIEEEKTDNKEVEVNLEENVETVSNESSSIKNETSNIEIGEYTPYKEIQTIGYSVYSYQNPVMSPSDILNSLYNLLRADLDKTEETENTEDVDDVVA